MSTTFEKGYALLIGVNSQQFPEIVPELPAVKNDVEKLAQILLDPERGGGYSEEDVRILIGKKASKLNIILALASLQEKLVQNPTASVLIYFSGHGYLKKDTNEYFLVPYNFHTADPSLGILDDFLVEKINALNAQRLLLLMDCCFAGSIRNNDSGFIRQTVNAETFKIKPVGDNEPAANTPIKPVGDNEPAANTPIKPGGEKNEGQSKDTNTRIVLVSSRESEFSYIHQKEEMSVFTYHLIEALAGHGKKGEEGDVINVADLISYVGDRVPITTQELHGDSQTPQVEYDGENFPIARLVGRQDLGEGLGAAQAPLSVAEIINITSTGSGIAAQVIEGNVSFDHSTGKSTAGRDNFTGATINNMTTNNNSNSNNNNNNSNSTIGSIGNSASPSERTPAKGSRGSSKDRKF